MVDAYYFCVGGGVGKHQRIARPIGYRAAATEVPAAIERLLRAYLAERADGQTFRDFTARHTDEELREVLAGAPVASVARDISPGRPPHGVDA
jgi:sulfite reductase (ferredoxin)